MAKIVIGLSGGVDSSVAAHLLKQQGHEVIGLFMRNWHDTTGTLSGDCPWQDDQVFAELVAKKLDIPFHYIDLSEQYGKRVVDYMFAEYERGRTPNPDVLCNREIKFDVFMDHALRLGGEFVATGHYCRREVMPTGTDPVYRLLAGRDSNKDQSYFLCQLSQKQLSRALFPIGGMTKPEVRAIAEQIKLPTAKRKDSQGICFVGKVDLPVFLQQKLRSVEGDIVEIPANWEGYRTYSGLSTDRANLGPLATPYDYSGSGMVIGRHIGAQYYTIGQRKGLHIGGRKEPLFVIGTDVGRNIVYVGQGQLHPGLYRRALFIDSSEVHWIREDLRMAAGTERSYSLRIRYRQPLQGGRLIVHPGGVYILFDEPQRGITAGQFAAWYDGEELLGSGTIAR